MKFGSARKTLQGLKSYNYEIWNVIPLSDRKTLPLFRILIFGLGRLFGTRTPFFGLFDISEV